MSSRMKPVASGESGRAERASHERVAPHSRRTVGLLLGPVLALAVYLIIAPAAYDASGAITSGLPHAGRAVAGVGVLMALFWVTEALPIPVTALLPIVLFPLLTGGVVPVRAATAPYAHELIFLFMGGFMLAMAMQRWGLHRRIALRTILLVGTEPARLVAGFMLAAAFLSMWVSNTATVVMMLPIATSVVELVRRELRQSPGTEGIDDGAYAPFAICLLLGTAYASSIGGIATLIGTPPNALLAAFVESQYGIEVSFVRWLGVGLPLAAVFLPIAWLVLTRLAFPIHLTRIPGGRDLIRNELRRQGPITGPERAVLVIFALTAAAWITRPLFSGLTLADGSRPLAGLSDAGIAIGAGVLLFALPVDLRRGVFLLSWKQAMRLPWGILILFGGGLSLASAVQATGVAAFIGHGVGGVGPVPTWLLVLLVVTTIVFLTELTSNTATTATFLPVLGAVAVGLGISPLMLLVPAAMAASCAFMMPVATPPNAIVFASGEITIPQMCKAGLWLNLIGIALLMGLMYTLAGAALRGW